MNDTVNTFISFLSHVYIYFFTSFITFHILNLLSVHKKMIMVIKDICNNNWAQEKRSRAWSSNIMISISVVSSTGIYFFYGYFWIPNFFFPDTASVYTYSVNPAYQSTTFWIRIPELKFLNILWIRNRVDAKSGCFLSGDVIRSSPALYHEYCIQDGNLEWSRELSVWSGNMSIIDTSTTSPF